MMNFKTSIVLFVLLSALFVGTFASNDDDDDDLQISISWSASVGNRESYQIFIKNGLTAYSTPKYKNIMNDNSYTVVPVGQTGALFKGSSSNTNVSDTFGNLQTGVVGALDFTAAHSAVGGRVRIQFSFHKNFRAAVYTATKVLVLPAATANSRSVEEEVVDLQVRVTDPINANGLNPTIVPTKSKNAFNWQVVNSYNTKLYKVQSAITCPNDIGAVTVSAPYAPTAQMGGGNTAISNGNQITGMDQDQRVYDCFITCKWATTSTGALVTGTPLAIQITSTDSGYRLAERDDNVSSSASVQALVGITAVACGVAIIAAVASVAAVVISRRRNNVQF